MAGWGGSFDVSIYELVVCIDMVMVACVVDGGIDGYMGHMGWNKDVVKGASPVFSPAGDIWGGWVQGWYDRYVVEGWGCNVGDE